MSFKNTNVLCNWAPLTEINVFPPWSFLQPTKYPSGRPFLIVCSMSWDVWLDTRWTIFGKQSANFLNIYITSARTPKSHSEIIYLLMGHFPAPDLGLRLQIDLWAPSSTRCDRTTLVPTHSWMKRLKVVEDTCQALIGLSIQLIATIYPLEMLFLFAFSLSANDAEDKPYFCSEECPALLLWHSLAVLLAVRRWEVGGEITEQMASPHVTSQVAMKP